MRILPLSPRPATRFDAPRVAASTPEPEPADRVQLKEAPAPPPAGQLARTGLDTAAALAGFQGRTRWEWWILKTPWRSCEPDRAREIRRADGPWMSVRGGLQDAAASYQAYEHLHQGVRSFQGDWKALHDSQLGQAWDDSPDEPYGPNENRSLTSSPICLVDLKRCQLTFRERHSLERSYDNVHLEASRDGQSWTAVHQFQGDSGGTRTQQFDLSAYDGDTVQLRFRLTSDGSTQLEGMTFGDLAITGQHKDGAARTLRVDAGDPASDRERLQQVAREVAPEQRLAAMGALGYLGDRLGTSGQALALWPSARLMLDRPDLQARLNELLDLSALVGARGANQVWPTLNDRSPADRKQDQAELRALVDTFKPAGAVQLWAVYDARQPDALDRLGALQQLAHGLGPEAAAPAFRALEGRPGSWEQRCQASLAAHRLHQLGHASQPMELYNRIRHLPSDKLAQMGGLAEHLTRGWRPEGRWGRADELRWGQVWSDSPDGPYDANANQSLTSSYLDVRDLGSPTVHMTAAWELERNYDKVNLECSPDGQEWTTLKSFSGSQAKSSVDVPLTGFTKGYLRLRLTSDGSTQLEGMRFSDFCIRGDLKGVPVERRIDSAWSKAAPKLEKLLQTVLGAEDQAATLGALAASAQEIGDGDRALAIWPSLKQELSEPDFEERRKFVTELTRRAGPEAALEVWSQVRTGDSAARQAALAKVDELQKAGQSPSEAVWMGSALVSQLGQPDLPARQAELLKLSASVGARAAARAANELERLDPQRPWQERASLYQSARRLLLIGGAEPERAAILQLYGRLKVLPTAEASALAALGEKAAFTVKAEAPWSAIPGGWSDSPDKNYPSHADASLFLGEISLQGLTRPRLTMQGRYEFERNYDSVSVEGRRPGRDWELAATFTGSQPQVQTLSADLSTFAGDRVELRLRLKSDGSTELAGMDFTQLAVRATDAATGDDVVLLPAGSRPPGEVRRELIDTVLKSPDPSRALDVIARATERLGSPEGGLALHQRIGQRLSDAALVERNLVLMESFADSAQLAPLVHDDAELKALQALAAGAGPKADLVKLWKGLGAGPELAERAACLGALAARLDTRSALQAMSALQKDTGRPWTERQAMYTSAVALAKATDQEPLTLYSALGGLSPASITSLGELGAQAQRQWTPSGSWGRELKPGWGQVWSDSPGKPYAPNTDACLTGPPLSLHGLHGVRAELEIEHELERNYDSVSLEVETPNGWKTATTWSGQTRRTSTRVDLSAYDGKEVRLRMRMKSDGSTEQEGFSFRGFKLVGTGTDGRERQLPMAEGGLDKKALRAFVSTALRNGDESCRLLSELAVELGDLNDALKLFGAIESERDKPDFAKTRQALTELVSALGGVTALERHQEFLTGTGEERLQRVRSYRLATDLAAPLGQDRDALYARLRGSTLTSGSCGHMRGMAAKDNWEALLALGTEAERAPERRERTLELLASLSNEQRGEMLRALDLAVRAGKLTRESPGDVLEKAIPVMLVSGSASHAIEQVLTAGLTGIRETEEQVIVGGVVVRRKVSEG